MYSSYELFEHVAVRPGSEEYGLREVPVPAARLGQGRRRGARPFAPYLTMLNKIRREHPALQQLRHIVFQQIDSDRMVAFSKRDGDDTIIVVVTLDPFEPREATLHLDMPSLGLDWHDRFVART